LSEETTSRRSWARRLSLWDWLFERISVYPAVLVRIGIGASMLAAYILYVPAIDFLYAPDGLASFTKPAEALPWLVTHHWRAWALMIIAATAFMVGLLTPVSGLALAYLQVQFISVSRVHTWGWSDMVAAFIVYVAFASSGARYSVDAWLHRRLFRAEPGATAVAWPIRVLMVHVCVVYLMVAWHRVEMPSWLDGDTVFIALQDSIFSRFPGADFQWAKPLLWLGCWVAWLFELVAPVALLVPRVRTVVALGLMGMHLGLELTSTVGWWQVLMFWSLFVFLPPDWSKRILRMPARLMERVRDRVPSARR
jgi:hypothetical protein